MGAHLVWMAMRPLGDLNFGLTKVLLGPFRVENVRLHNFRHPATLDSAGSPGNGQEPEGFRSGQDPDPDRERR